MLARTLQALVLCALIAGCGGGGSVSPPFEGGGGGPSASPNPTVSPSPTQSPTPTPSPTPSLHVYITGKLDDGPAVIYSYPLPITQTSSFDGRILGGLGVGGPQGMAFGQTHMLFVVGSSGSASAFVTPFMSNEAPTFSFNEQLQPSDIAFDGAGDAFITRSLPTPAGNGTYLGFIDVFTPPIAANSTASFTIGGNNGIQADVAGVAFDRSGDLWISAITTAALSGRIYEYKAPFNAQSVPAISFRADQSGPGIVFDSAGNLYSAGLNGVNVYRPPFTASTEKAFTIPTPVSAPPKYLAFDPLGNLYVTYGGSFVMYTPPFSANMAPTVGLGTPSGAANGIAIGP